MVIKLKSFRRFAEIDYKNKDQLYVVGQNDKEFHDVYSGFFSKDDPNEIIIDSLLLHKGTDQLLEIIYKSGKNRFLNLRLIRSYHYQEYSKEDD
jgi:hypothetical protein